MKYKGKIHKMHRSEVVICEIRLKLKIFLEIYWFRLQKALSKPGKGLRVYLIRKLERVLFKARSIKFVNIKPMAIAPAVTRTVTTFSIDSVNC